MPAPKNEVIADLLKKIANKEKFELQPQVALSIAQNSRRNIRRAVMMLQTMKLKNPNLSN